MAQGSRSSAPTPRLPLLEHPAYAVRRIGEAVDEDAPEIFIFSDVLEELCYRAAFDPENHSLSLLTGGWYVGPLGAFLEIEGFRDSLAVDGAMAALEHLQHHPELLEPPPSLPMQAPERLLGCAFAAPGSEAKMSPELLIFLNTWFNLPFHVLLLIDAAADRFAFYLRDSEGDFLNAPCHLIEERPIEEA